MMLIEVNQCESTNTEIWNYKDQQPVLLTTQVQTQGRGQFGRSWVSEPGNLFFSLLYSPEHLQLDIIPILAGLALQDSILEIFKKFFLGKKKNLRLKLPNDLYYTDAKIAGILCESKFNGSTLAGVVVGIGVNLISAPTLNDKPTTSIASCLEISADEVLAKRNFIIFKWHEFFKDYENRLLLNQLDINQIKTSRFS